MTINNGRYITMARKREAHLSTVDIAEHNVQRHTMHHPYEPNCPVMDFWTIEAMLVAKQHVLSWHRIEFTGILGKI